MKNIIVVFVVLAAVGLGAYFMMSGNSPDLNPVVTPTPGLGTATPTAQPSTSPKGPATPTPKPTATPSVSTTPTPSSVSVNITNFVFVPGTLTVKTGTRVTWTNNDNVAHTVTSDSGTLLNSSLFGKGQSFSFTFNTVGTFNYHCAPHPGMRGTVIVTN